MKEFTNLYGILKNKPIYCILKNLYLTELAT